MLKQFTDWLFDLVVKFFTAAFTFLADVFVAIVKTICDVLVGLLSAIPVPGFLSSGMSAFFGDLAPGILWALTALGLPAGFAIIGAGYGFRLARKVVTLFQW